MMEKYRMGARITFRRFAWCLLSASIAIAEPVVIRSDAPNEVRFSEAGARFVRLVISATQPPGEPCIDELEVYGPDSSQNLALAQSGARATASSCLPGHAIHQTAHLNDGQYGNSYSWVAAGSGEEWAQIELPETVLVDRVVFSRDRLGQFRDRVPVALDVLLSLDGEQWQSAAHLEGCAGCTRGEEAIPAPPPSPIDYPVTEVTGDYAEQLRYAFLGEEHAWLKTYGRADISPELVPYNGRVQRYPRHVGDDVLPLPCLGSAPTLDGVLDEPSWQGASRGVIRVAHPYDFSFGPLVEYAVSAGLFGDTLYLAIETGRLLSAHVAVVGAGDGRGAGVVALQDGSVVFNTYMNRKVEESKVVESGVKRDLTHFECALPLAWFEGAQTQGIRVGLGIGGKHTPKIGRPVLFKPASFAIAEDLDARTADTFTVRVTSASALMLMSNAPNLLQGIQLASGETKRLRIPASRGPIGPQFDLTVQESGGEPYVLHLFRYDPIERPLRQIESMIARHEEQGADTKAEIEILEALGLEEWRGSSFAEASADAQETTPQARQTQRDLFERVRLAQRRIFLRDPDLAPVQEILFEKRNPFEPSHNYSDYFDARYRPGGAIATLHVPTAGGALAPEAAAVDHLFDAKKGIARNPMADFGLECIYFGYRATKDGYYHLMSMNGDGSGLKQITDGPFHDFWPCPLPDGGLAFISTRCTSRVFCWRPQSSVLFRMQPDGSDIRPVSLANITEWAPSVMNDGRIIWTRWEYVDKAADFGHTLWAIRPDGTYPELVYGNTIIQPNGYANGREVPNTNEICCTLISHFGDLNGPIALVDLNRGRFNPEAIQAITPEVPWPGAPPREECFREAVPISRDLFLCSHAPRDHFCLYVIDRFGNREMLYADPAISSMCPTLFQKTAPPPVVAGSQDESSDWAEFLMEDVHEGLAPDVPPGMVKYVRVVEEVRHGLEVMDDGEYRKDHEAFFDFYASPVDLVNGPNGWPAYVAKAAVGLVPVNEDGSAHFRVPAGKVLYFQALDENYNEVQRMRSVVQLQPGERRSCIGCHEHRQMAPLNRKSKIASGAVTPLVALWSAGPFSYERVVQPVLDRHCASCHDRERTPECDLTSTKDGMGIPASYRTLISKGHVHYVDCGWNSGGCEKLAPLTFGSLKSPLFPLLEAGHHEVKLSADEMLRIKTWIDLNCPLWPDYQDRTLRAKAAGALAKGQ